eukprot:SAG11_NODE_1288_length_5297_cov_13.005194_3_plen_165_part_00
MDRRRGLHAKCFSRCARKGFEADAVLRPAARHGAQDHERNGAPGPHTDERQVPERAKTPGNRTDTTTPPTTAGAEELTERAGIQLMTGLQLDDESECGTNYPAYRVATQRRGICLMDPMRQHARESRREAAVATHIHTPTAPARDALSNQAAAVCNYLSPTRVR